MTRYDVYLEIGDEGEAMAHIMELPGCHARGPNRGQALEALASAIREYHSLLRQHGEDAPDPPAIELEVVEIVPGTAPFRRGSMAALFESDICPMTRSEMEETYFKLA